tara:strand:+ start:12 stop:548 length:537 start_codon:yes stop_codon:yes gene_type:complete
MLEGKKVYLIKIQHNSLEEIRKWRNKSEIKQYIRQYNDINQEEQEKWYNNNVINTDTQFNFEIRLKEGNKLIGQCGLNNISWINRSAEFSIIIGYSEFRGYGYGSDAIRILIKYGFEELNLIRIHCEVFENNPGACKLYKYLGFKEEGCMRQSYFNSGKYWDTYILSMLKSEYSLETD